MKMYANKFQHYLPVNIRIINAYVCECKWPACKFISRRTLFPKPIHFNQIKMSSDFICKAFRLANQSLNQLAPIR